MLRKYQPKSLIGLFGLIAMVSALGVAAVSAASASAAIEVLWCMLSTTAKYETRGKCENLEETGAGALEWEWEKGPLAGETGASIPLVDFSSANGTLRSGAGNISCTADSGTGEVLGPNDISNILVTFTTCTGPFGEQCNSPGMAAGEILTEELLGEFVYLKAGGKLPLGLLLEPNNAGKEFATIECLLTVVVTGAVIGEVSPVNSEVNSVLINFKALTGKLTEQEWTKVEEAATKFELSAGGGQASEETDDDVELLTNPEGTYGLTIFEIMA